MTFEAAAVGAAQVARADDPPVEQTQENIQVLTGLPTSQLIPVMTVMANSLGVTCAHCHAERWESDEKLPKERARAMLRMTLGLNRDFFDGRTAVGCNSCHRGALRPRATPRIEDAGWNRKPVADAARPERSLPSVAAVIERYVSVIGGHSRIQRIRARRLEGIVTSDSGRASRAGRFEIALERPDRVEAKADISYPGEARRWLATLFLADFLGPGVQARMAVVGRDQIDGRETVAVALRRRDGSTHRLEFDGRRGDLVRISDETPTPVGPMPEEYRLSDYRKVDGVRIPFAIEWSRGDYRVVHRVTRVEQAPGR